MEDAPICLPTLLTVELARRRAVARCQGVVEDIALIYPRARAIAAHAALQYVFSYPKSPQEAVEMHPAIPP